MVTTDRPPRNGLNASSRRIYNPIGFNRLYNFILWFICSGALFGFVLSRSPYMNYYGIFCKVPPLGPNLSAGPGECYQYSTRHVYTIGIIMHLVTIIPAGILVLIQFIPVIRHKFIIVHRLNGYLVILLILFSHAGALMIARVSFGGTLATQLWVGVVALATTIFFFLAWVNIKRLQIDQHRKWMLRAWVWLASIITERIIFKIVVPIISSIGSYYYAMPCSKILGTFKFFGIPQQVALKSYPPCQLYLNGTAPLTHVAVHAKNSGTPEQIAAVFDISFGMALWLGLVIHIVGIEIYLHLTPAESDRLRQVSYERQIEAGMKNPGSAGLTADRFGDSNPVNYGRSLEKRQDSDVSTATRQ